MEADAIGSGSIANASFCTHYPLKARYPQPNPKPSRADWQKAGYLTAAGKVAPKLYVGYYVGDYDSPSWLYKAVAAFFSDPQRGRVPLGWAFDPNLADRAPQALAYAYRHATTNDFFIAGDSGAGYLNPTRPDGTARLQAAPALKVWTEHCARYFKQWDMTITGFVLDGSAGGICVRGVRRVPALQPGRLRKHFRPDAPSDFRCTDHPRMGHAQIGREDGCLHGRAGSGRVQRAAFSVGAGRS